MRRPFEQTVTEWLISLAAWAGVGLLFWRALWWLADATIAREQVAHAAVVLVFGLVFLLRERVYPVVLRFGRGATGFFFGACGAAMLAGIFREPLLMLVALGALAGAVLLFVYGDDLLRVATGLGLAFSGFTLLAIVFPLADWPLRLLAGRMAMWFLGIFGGTVELGLAGQPTRLLLVSAGRPFEVATECNGFGIISGCILLSLLLVFSRRVRLVDNIIVLVLAPLLGLISNALRIFLIVLLAPHVGDHYALLHEAVGISLFFGTLSLLWWLVSGLPERAVRENPPSRKGPDRGLVGG